MICCYHPDSSVALHVFTHVGSEIDSGSMLQHCALNSGNRMSTICDDSSKSTITLHYRYTTLELHYIKSNRVSTICDVSSKSIARGRNVCNGEDCGSCNSARKINEILHLQTSQNFTSSKGRTIIFLEGGVRNYPLQSSFFLINAPLQSYFFQKHLPANIF